MSRFGYATSTRPGPRSVLLFLAACSPGSELFIQKVWPSDQPAVLIVTGDDGEILAPSPAIIESPVGLLAIPAEERGLVYVQIFPQLRGRDLSTCAISTSDGDELGAPASGWSSGAVSLKGAIQLEVEENPTDFDLRISGCAIQPKSCESVTTHVVSPVLYTGLQGVAAISDSEMFATGGTQSDVDLRTAFVRVSGDSAVLLDPIDALEGESVDLETDGDTLIGATGNRIYRLDLAGRLLSSSTVAFMVEDLDTGTDGTTIFVGRGGQLVAASRGSSELRAIEPPAYGSDPVPDFPKIGVENADNFVVYGPDRGIWVYQGSWREELTEIDDEIDGVAADDRFILVAPTDGSALLFDSTTGDWAPIGHVFLTANVKVVDALGGGRFLAGQGGRVAHYNGERMCVILTGPERTLDDIDFAPSGKAAFAVGVGDRAPFTAPAILRIDFP